jgi:hypothetical protein
VVLQKVRAALLKGRRHMRGKTGVEAEPRTEPRGWRGVWLGEAG